MVARMEHWWVDLQAAEKDHLLAGKTAARTAAQWVGSWVHWMAE